MQQKVILDQISVEDFTNRIGGIIREAVSSTVIPQGSDEYLTRKQTAKLLQISLVTLRDWSVKGILQSYKIGGRIRYKKSELDEALKAQKNLKYRRDR